MWIKALVQDLALSELYSARSGWGIRQVVVEVLIVLEFRIGLRKGGDQAGTVGGGAGLDVDVPVGAGKQFL